MIYLVLLLDERRRVGSMVCTEAVSFCTRIMREVEMVSSRCELFLTCMRA